MTTNRHTSRFRARNAHQLRELIITPNVQPNAKGSCMISMGNTKLICSATVDHNTPSFLHGQNKGWLTAEYGMLPTSTNSRMKREAAMGHQTARTQEIQRLIGRSLRAALELEKLSGKRIIIDCDVIVADGGTRCAAVTGGFVAMSLAVHALLASGEIAANPIRHAIAAVSAGMVDGVALLDLNYAEDSQCDSDVNIVMASSGGLVEIQGTAEGALLQYDELETLLALAKNAGNVLFNAQNAAIKQALASQAEH